MSEVTTDDTGEEILFTYAAIYSAWPWQNQESSRKLESWLCDLVSLVLYYLKAFHRYNFNNLGSLLAGQQQAEGKGEGVVEEVEAH